MPVLGARHPHLARQVEDETDESGGGTSAPRPHGIGDKDGGICEYDECEEVNSLPLEE